MFINACFFVKYGMTCPNVFEIFIKITNDFIFFFVYEYNYNKEYQVFQRKFYL